MCFLLTSYPKPVIVELLDQKDDEDGLPEKSIIKNPQYYQSVCSKSYDHTCLLNSVHFNSILEKERQNRVLSSREHSNSNWLKNGKIYMNKKSNLTRK